MITAKNLIQGKLVSGSIIKINVSPIDGKEISTASLLSHAELVDVFEKAKLLKTVNAKKTFSNLLKLSEYIKQNRSKFISQIILDSGFTFNDAEDIIRTTIEFCNDFHSHLEEVGTKKLRSSFSFTSKSSIKITQTSDPYGLISIITPRNAPLIIELTAIINALWAGNTVVLRPSFGVVGTIYLLIEGIQKSFSPEISERLNIVFVDAQDFSNTSLDYSDLLHYIGSSKYLESTLIAGIKKGVKVLVDGDGFSVVVVDATAKIEDVALACYQGLIRCNGQLCTTVRAIIIHRSIYKKFRTYFQSLISKTNCLPPDTKMSTAIGPLFSSDQVDNINKILEQYQSPNRSKKGSELGPNYIFPTLIELSPSNYSFLKMNFYGPLIGITHFLGDSWKKWVRKNPSNLTDGVFSDNKKFIDEFAHESKSPRKTINIDPSVESVFEPWGAYLPSGSNDVSYWYEKYRRYYQLVQG